MKAFIISIIAIAFVFAAYSTFSRTGGAAGATANGGPANNVTVVNGTQIIEIRARGGYQPRHSVAKAGLPTVIRFDTAGTFDCSASVRIPSLGVSQILPQSGSTDISIGTQKISSLQGSCGMGMYPFDVSFEG